MTPLSQRLMELEWGLPNAQSRIREEIDQITEYNLANDFFRFETVELPSGFHHSFFHHRDFIAVLSINKTDQNVQRLALWSLAMKNKLWETEAIESAPFPRCIISDCGMVLMQGISDEIIILIDGKQSGIISEIDWDTKSVFLIEKRILSARMRYHDNKQDWFFDERDEKGIVVTTHPLSRKHYDHTYACNKDFWVRLSNSEPHLASIIEVVNRVTETIKTFTKAHPARFTSSCIVEKQLFCGKISGNQSTICIYDLINGKIIKEFPTERPAYQLVANESYLAWLNHRHEPTSISYLNIANGQRENILRVSSHYMINCSINLLGTLLSLTYEGRLSGIRSNLHRIVIDMEKKSIARHVKYNHFTGRQCFASNGCALITDPVNDQIYIESFIGVGLSHQKSPFRKEL